MIGRRIGSWILERELGHGGMGSVYQARHATLNTRAAVKVVSPGLESEESFRQRFHREAELQAQLRHPNVARVLDYLEDGGHWFLVVEFVDGGSLADHLARGEKVPRTQAIAWAKQALAGLAHAHQKGIVHRDIKPANLLIGANGEIVVMDFGIARSDAAPSLTATGATVGTPHYMSPEQIVSPDRVDRRSDIYSLGIVLYEVLAGRKPFDAGSQFAILHAQVSEAPPPLRAIDPTVPPALEAIVMRALAKNPNERFGGCEAMIHELDRAGTMPAAPVSGATIHSSRLFEPALVQGGSQLSPGEARNQRRRAFQRKLATGAVATATVATLLAVKLSSDAAASKPEPGPLASAAAATESGTPPVAVPRTDTVAPPSPPPDMTTRQITHTQRPAAEPVHNSVFTTTTRESSTTPPVSKVFTPPPSPPPAQPPLITTPTLPPLPERPRVAVIGMGKEPLLAGSLEQEMERRLIGHFDVGDEHGDPEISELLAQKDKTVSQPTLGAALLRGGFHVLVLVRVAEGDRESVKRFGVEGSVIAARMHLNAYLLPANRSIGPGWTQTVEYTETAAAGKARQAFIGPTADLRKAINDDWAALRATR